jgi:hypothetical protein
MTEQDVAVALGMSIVEYFVRYERGMVFTPSTRARPRCHQRKSLFPLRVPRLSIGTTNQ